MNGFSAFTKSDGKKKVTTKKHANKLFEYSDPDSDTTFGEVVAKKETKNIIKK